MIKCRRFSNRKSVLRSCAPSQGRIKITYESIFRKRIYFLSPILDLLFKIWRNMSITFKHLLPFLLFTDDEIHLGHNPMS